MEEQDTEARYKIGDFIRFSNTGKNEHTLTYVVLAKPSGAKKGWTYKIESANGAVQKSIHEEKLQSAEDEHKQKWLDDRLDKLTNSESAGEFFSEYSTKDATITASALKQSVQFLELSADQRQAVTEAINQTLQDGKIQWKGGGQDKIPSVLEKSGGGRNVPSSRKTSTGDAGESSEPEPGTAIVPKIIQAVPEIEVSNPPSGIDAEVLVNVLLPEQALTPEQQAEKLADQWEKALPETVEGQRELAEEMRQFLRPQELPEAVKTIDRLLESCDIEPAAPHPLFWMLSGSATPTERRHLIARLNLIQLEHYIGWLVEQSSVPSAQLENLLDAVSDQLSQKFQEANREGGVNHYRRIAEAMNKLLSKMDSEARQPYEWRLFSFLREGWAWTAPHAQAGSNDLSGARDYLLWILESKELWPEIIWKELLTKILQDAALDKLAAEVRQSLFMAAAEYALAAEPGKRSMRLLVMQQALSEEMLLEFIIVAGRKADQGR